MKGYGITFCQPVGLRKFQSLCQQIHTDRRLCSRPLANYKGKCVPDTQSSISPMPFGYVNLGLMHAKNRIQCHCCGRRISKVLGKGRYSWKKLICCCLISIFLVLFGYFRCPVLSLWIPTAWGPQVGCPTHSSALEQWLPLLPHWNLPAL